MENLKVDLLPHNQKAYESAEKMLEDKGKAAIIHPTGTGKSYIALKLIQDNSEKKILYIAPNLAILEQFNEKVEKFGLNRENIEIISYQKLNSMRKSEELSKKKYDVIIIDEFHHYTGEKWGLTIDTLLENNSSAKILGLTATPLRYGVGKEVRDVADEIFEDAIASEMNTQDAIDKGILPTPDYTVGIYDYVDILENLKNIENSKSKDELYKEQLNEIEKRLQKAVETLPDLLKEKMSKSNGKYLIFCSTIEDMNEKIEQAQKMFGKVNDNITIRSISSSENDQQKNKTTIKEFEDDQDPDTLKLMYCVDMLNEGYHLEDLDGGIMIRKTNSPTLYTQQLGRLLQTTKGTNPIVIDLVNNIDAIKEVEEFARSLNGIGNRRTNFKFKISRETENIFDKIDELMDRQKRRNPQNEKYDRLLAELKCPRKIIMNDQNMKRRCNELAKLKAKRDLIKDNDKEKRALNKIIKNIRDKIITDNMWLAEELAKQIDINDIDDEKKTELAYQGLITTIDGFELNNHKVFSRECAKNIYQILKFNEKESALEQYFENYNNKEDLIQAIDIIENAKIKLQQKLFTEDVGLEAISRETGFDKRLIQKLMEIKEDTERKEHPESLEEIEDKDSEYDNDIYQTDEDERDRNISTIYPKGDNVESIAEKNVDNELLKSKVYEVLNTIFEREKIVLIKHYLKEKNYTEIGKDLGLSHSRIGQIHAKALRKLSYSSHYKKLLEFKTNELLDNDNTEYEVTNYNNNEKKASIMRDEIEFQEFATELLEDNYIATKQIEYSELKEKLNELEKLLYSQEYIDKEESKRIRSEHIYTEEKIHENRNEIEKRIFRIGQKYKTQDSNNMYWNYFRCNDSRSIEKLRLMALKLKLKRDLVELKIPEKQRLQREYMELTKERTEKGDK